MTNMMRWRRIWRQEPVFTYLLLAVNLIMLLWLEWKGGSQVIFNLVHYGGRYNPFIVYEQEYWRWITATFLHAGWEHFFYNSINLFILGIYLERIIGHWRFLAVYLFAALFGSLVSFAFEPTVVSVGASTALFGMFGAIIFLDRCYHYDLGAFGRAIAVMLVLSIFSTFRSADIDISGHFGGLIGGVLTAAWLCAPWHLKHRRRYQAAAIIASVVLATLAIWYGWHQTQLIFGIG